MTNNYKNILLKVDELGAYETPENFNFKDLEVEIQHLRKGLEKEFKEDFHLDTEVQDASFFGDLLIPDILIKAPKKDYRYAIRISNFGNLATFTFRDPETIFSSKKIIKIIEDSRFTYIPYAELDADYDGSFEEFKALLGPGNCPSWWIRYFDYL